MKLLEKLHPIFQKIDGKYLLFKIINDFLIYLSIKN